MSAALKSKAAANLNKGQPSCFYPADKANPVLTALEKEIAEFVTYVKKKASSDKMLSDGEACSRPSDILFDLWTKFEPRLAQLYYQQKLLDMGDFLMSIKEYKLALWQCYERYLKHFGDISIEEITDVGVFSSYFFPNGFQAEGVGLTFRALMGKCISMYRIVQISDPKLQKKESVDGCVHILGLLRLTMQAILPLESLYWVVFNGTIHLYTISRHLMSKGYSSRVVEYLLWATVCMETSIPLMSVSYLSWRITLYSAVCQCYYDCRAGQLAEAFAKHGLARINQLSHLEYMSSSICQTALVFRQATVTMAVLIFKRAVFESRRKPKGLLRPKTRANLKDCINTPWPRTATEKLLTDMFEGSSAQFLAILESLTDSNRRLIQTSPPAPDSEPEILDVYAELFLAAQEILAGGGGTQPNSKTTSQPLSAIVQHCSHVDLATRGEDGVPLKAAIQLVKMAYNFENWDVFQALVDPVLICIKVVAEGI